MQMKNTLGKTLLVSGMLATLSAPAFAGGKIKIDDTKWISVGAGLRTSIASVSDSAPDGSSSKNFNLENARLYISGQATKDFKFYFGTEKMFGEYGVLDAIIQYEPSEKFNVWMGRMLTPADRIEMNGPFYGLTWNQYTVPLYPSDNDPTNGANGAAGTFGRDEGITVWGSFDKFQYAIGIFDGYNNIDPNSANNENQSGAPLYAARFAYNFMSKESNPGYYTSSTYYGKGGDILTLAISAQSQSDGYGTVASSGSFSGYAVDFLFEKPMANNSAVTVEAEYKSFDVSNPGGTFGSTMFDGEAHFASFAYLLPGDMGASQYQPYLRVTSNSPTIGDSSSLTEIGVNYIISGHNMRLNLNYTTGDAGLTGAKATNDIDTILFGMQFQI